MVIAWSVGGEIDHRNVRRLDGCCKQAIHSLTG
jgi:hypothetical protein